MKEWIDYVEGVDIVEGDAYLAIQVFNTVAGFVLKEKPVIGGPRRQSELYGPRNWSHVVRYKPLFMPKELKL